MWTLGLLPRSLSKRQGKNGGLPKHWAAMQTEARLMLWVPTKKKVLITTLKTSRDDRAPQHTSQILPHWPAPHPIQGTKRCHAWVLAREKLSPGEHSPVEKPGCRQVTINSWYCFYLLKLVAEQGPYLHFLAKHKMAFDLTMEDSEQSLGCLKISPLFSEEGEKQRSLRHVGCTFLWKRPDNISCFELAFPSFKAFSCNFCLSSTLGGGLGSCKKPHFHSRQERCRALLEIPQPPLEPLHQQWGQAQHTILFPQLKELQYKIACSDFMGFFFFHSCLESVSFYPFLPTFIESSPSPHTLSPNWFQLLLHLPALAANLPASQSTLGAHRSQSCVPRLPVACSQGWKNGVFF